MTDTDCLGSKDRKTIPVYNQPATIHVNSAFHPSRAGKSSTGLSGCTGATVDRDAARSSVSVAADVTLAEACNYVCGVLSKETRTVYRLAITLVHLQPRITGTKPLVYRPVEMG